MIGHGLPVVAALGGRADVELLADALFEDVAAVSWLAGFGVDAGEEILEDGLLKAEEASGGTV